jgi:hypothetical protein
MATEELTADITATMDGAMTLRTSFRLSADIEIDMTARAYLETDSDERTGLITGY